MPYKYVKQKCREQTCYKLQKQNTECYRMTNSNQANLIHGYKQHDTNQSDLQLYLTDITSQRQRASSSNFTAAPLKLIYGEIKDEAVGDFNKCREHCMGKVLLSQWSDTDRPGLSMEPLMTE